MQSGYYTSREFSIYAPCFSVFLGPTSSTPSKSNADPLCGNFPLSPMLPHAFRRGSVHSCSEVFFLLTALHSSTFHTTMDVSPHNLVRLYHRPPYTFVHPPSSRDKISCFAPLDRGHRLPRDHYIHTRSTSAEPTALV
jgi:hypothetical protein